MLPINPLILLCKKQMCVVQSMVLYNKITLTDVYMWPIRLILFHFTIKPGYLHKLILHHC